MSTPKISIITPSVRPDGLKIIHESLKKQTFQDFEWLLGTPFDPEIPDAIWVEDDFTGGYWTLNRIYNRLFQRAQGDLIVSWQDFIWVPPDGLEKFALASQLYDGVISGVGDQYERLSKYGKPEVKIWFDPRKTDKYGPFYEVYPNDAEWNWCAIPKKDLFAVGGMDEQLDFLGFGGDQFQVGERLDAMGVHFYLDQTNESFTLRHSRDKHGGEDNWNKHHVLFNGAYDTRKAELKKLGKWPCVNYI